MKGDVPATIRFDYFNAQRSERLVRSDEVAPCIIRTPAKRDHWWMLDKEDSLLPAAHNIGVGRFLHSPRLAVWHQPQILHAHRGIIALGRITQLTDPGADAENGTTQVPRDVI
jgi:hypothetical protein